MRSDFDGRHGREEENLMRKTFSFDRQNGISGKTFSASLTEFREERFSAFISSSLAHQTLAPNVPQISNFMRHSFREKSRQSIKRKSFISCVYAKARASGIQEGNGT